MSVKKILLIIRHSKTENSFGFTNDIERKLTERGHNDAALMAKMVQHKGYKIDQLFISPATRTQQSAQYYIDTFNLTTDKFEVIKKLYAATATTIENTIVSVDNNITTLAILAHNPGVTDFLITHGLGKYFDDLPTSGVGIFEFEGEWCTFLKSPKKLIEVLTVKALS